MQQRLDSPMRVTVLEQVQNLDLVLRLRAAWASVIGRPAEPDADDTAIAWEDGEIEPKDGNRT
jgi:hypothetical protein